MSVAQGNNPSRIHRGREGQPLLLAVVEERGMYCWETPQKAFLRGGIKGRDNTMRLKWGNELKPREDGYYLGIFLGCFSLV